MNKEINQVCTPCGITANYLTCLQRYGERPHKPAFHVSTYSRGVCDVCHKPQVSVTEPRDFFYPDFSLIGRVAKFLHNPSQDGE